MVAILGLLEPNLWNTLWVRFRGLACGAICEEAADVAAVNGDRGRGQMMPDWWNAPKGRFPAFTPARPGEEDPDLEDMGGESAEYGPRGDEWHTCTRSSSEMPGYSCSIDMRWERSCARF